MLGGLLVVQVLVIPLGLHAGLGVPRSSTMPHHVRALMAGWQDADSWKPMAAARRFADTHPHASIYEEVFFRQRTKFQYPPTSLLLIGTLERSALNAISRVAAWLTILLSVFLFERSLRVNGWHPAGRGEAALRATIAACLGLSFYPLVKAYSLGQIQIWIDALFAILITAWWTRAPGISGAALGLICLIKPQFALLAVWGGARRQWRFLAGCLAVVVVGLAASVVTFGLASHVDYVRVLGFISRRGEAFYANQSFNGLFNRLLFNGESLVWQDHAFAPAHYGIYVGTTAIGIVLIGAALLLPRRPARSSVIDLSIVSLTAVVVSPVAWEHHYGVLLPLMAATCGQVLRLRPFGASTAPVLAAAFVLTGQYFEPAQRFASTWLNVVQSYVLAGGLLFLALWYRTSRVEPGHPGPQAQPPDWRPFPSGGVVPHPTTASMARVQPMDARDTRSRPSEISAKEK